MKGIGEWFRRHALLLFVISSIVIIGAGVFYVYYTQYMIHKKVVIKVKRKYFHHNLLAVDAGDEKNVWAVGYRGIILHSDDSGVTWKRQHSNTRATLADVDFINAKEGWAVGQWCTILHTEDGGKHWIKQKVPKDMDPMTYLCSVHFIDSKDGWVCGNNAAVLHTKDGGKTWELFDMTDYVDWTTQFNGIYFIDKNNGWLVGEQGICLHTTNGGEDWDVVDLGIGKKTLFAVKFLPKDPKKGYIVGVEGILLYTNDGGKTWQPPQWSGLPVKEHVFNVVFVASPEYNPASNLGLNVYAVGRGVFLHTYGQLQKNWESVIDIKLPPRHRPLEYTWLRGIAWPNDHIGIVVGEDGLILRSWDQGLHWVWIPYGYEYE